MNYRRLAIACAAMVAWLPAVNGAAAPVDAPAQVELVRIRNLIVVRQRIVAGVEPVVVPDCGPADFQERSLCTLAVRIEVETDRGWVAAPLNSEIGSVPGGYPIEHGPVAVIKPGTAADFAFIINKQDYLLSVGQNLRLRVSTWLTEEALRAGGPKREIVTKPFTVS